MSDSRVSGARFVGLRGPLAAVPALVAGLLVLGWVFRAEASAAEDVWEASAAYAHCFAVVPIAAWLVWERRHGAAALAPRPNLALALVALPVSAVWLLASLAGLMEGRQLAALATGEVLAAAVLGGALFRVLSAPLLFLFFLVPTGAFLTPDFAGFHGSLHGQWPRPHWHTLCRAIQPDRDSGGNFHRRRRLCGASFSNGIRDVRHAYTPFTIYRSPVRRGLFVVASIIVPILANGARALGLVLVGHVLGSAQSVAVDHVLYGWLFFSLVTLALVAGGLPFREDIGLVREAEPQPLPRETGERAWIAGASVVAMACIGPALAGLLPTAAAGAQESAAAARVAGECPRCGRLSCDWHGRDAPRLFLSRRPPYRQRAGPPAAWEPRAQLAAEANAAFAGLEREPSPVGAMAGWEIAGDGHKIAALGVWVNGKLLGSGLTGRLEQARVVVAGGRDAPVLITVSAVADPARTEPASILRTFIDAQGELEDVIRREASPAATDGRVRSEPSL